MATSDYTPMKDKGQLEAYVKNNPDFLRLVRFEPHTEREGYLLITDGSYSFGMMQEDDVNQVLSEEVSVDDLKSQPEVLKHISCYDINRNTKAYEREASKTTIDRLEEKVSFFAPNKKMLVVLAFIVILAIAAPFLSSRVFSNTSKSGYSDDFYKNDMANVQLLKFHDNWVKFVETDETSDAKKAGFLKDSILKFSQEVDRSRLNEKQLKALDILLEKVQAFDPKNIKS